MTDDNEWVIDDKPLNDGQGTSPLSKSFFEEDGFEIDSLVISSDVLGKSSDLELISDIHSDKGNTAEMPGNDVLVRPNSSLFESVADTGIDLEDGGLIISGLDLDVGTSGIGTSGIGTDSLVVIQESEPEYESGNSLIGDSSFEGFEEPESESGNSLIGDSFDLGENYETEDVETSSVATSVSYIPRPNFVVESTPNLTLRVISWFVLIHALVFSATSVATIVFWNDLGDRGFSVVWFFILPSIVIMIAMAISVLLIGGLQEG